MTRSDGETAPPFGPGKPELRLVAVDPGDRHCGVAGFRLLSPDSPRNRSGGWRAACEWSRELTPDQTVELFESTPRIQPGGATDLDEFEPEQVDVYVVEQFRLYPWKAREQGYSDFKTPRLIGKLEYLAERGGTPCYLQGADIKKQSVARVRRWITDVPPARRGADPAVAKLSSGRFDFVGRNQHVRDAIAHGWWWLLTNDDSPMKGADQR